MTPAASPLSSKSLLARKAHAKQGFDEDNSESGGSDSDGSNKRRNFDLIVEGLSTSKETGLSIFQTRSSQSFFVEAFQKPRVRQYVQVEIAFISLPLTANILSKVFQGLEKEAFLTIHLAGEERCKKMPLPREKDCMDKEKKMELKKKKREPSRTEEDKWRDVYRILFPERDSEIITLPCISIPIKVIHINSQYHTLTYRQITRPPKQRILKPRPASRNLHIFNRKGATKNRNRKTTTPIRRAETPI